MDNCKTLINYDKRMIYIGGQITTDNIADANFGLLTMLYNDDTAESKEVNFKREPIHVYINSYGGMVDEMWGLINIMLTSKSPIHTYCTGYAFSAAFCLFLAGSERSVYNYSSLMYHQISSGAIGKFEDIYDSALLLKKSQEIMERYVVDRTKLTQSDLDEIREYKKDFYIDCDEALKYDIATEIIC